MADIIPTWGGGLVQVTQKEMLSGRFEIMSSKPPTDLQSLARIIRAGRIALVKIGTVIPLPWIDTVSNTLYNAKATIVDKRVVEDQNGHLHNAAIIQFTTILPFQMQVDPVEPNWPFGNPNYEQSSIRQFLNSAKGVGEWWSADHDGDVAPQEAETMAGFLTGFSESQLSCMQTIKIAEKYGNTIYEHYDKWWLPSATELYATNSAFSEDAYFEYWKEATGFNAPSTTHSEARDVYTTTGQIVSTLYTRSRTSTHELWRYVRLYDFIGNGTARSYSSIFACCAVY